MAIHRRGPNRFARPRLKRSLLLRAAKSQAGWIGLGMALGGAGFSLQFLQAQAAVAVVDIGIDAGTKPLGPLVLVLFGLSAAMAVTNSASLLTLDKVRWGIEYKVRRDLHRNIQAHNPSDLDDVPAGQVVTRAVEDMARFQSFVYLAPIIVGSVPAVLGGMAYLGWINFPLMLLAFSPIPINLLLVAGLYRRLPALTWAQLDQSAEVTRSVDEPIRGIRVVKLFGREHDEATKLARAALGAYRVVMTRVFLLARYDIALKTVPAIMQAALLLFGARAVIGGSLTQGQFLVFFVGSAQVAFFARSLDAIVNHWIYARTASTRIGELTGDEQGDLIGPPPVAQGVGGGQEPRREATEPISGSASGAPRGLSAEGVVTSSNGRVVFSGVGLTALPGEVVGITGDRDAQLSVLAGALAGVLPIDAGSVTVDNEPISGWTPGHRSLRVQLLGPEPFLFARSIRENLLLGSSLSGGDDRNTKSRDIDLAIDLAIDRAIDAAIDAAGARDVIDGLDGGVDAVLGDRGLDLSGGQRQRLALARALVFPPEVLILDDALSGVHNSLASQILDRCRTHAPDTAVVLLTTDTELLRSCDRQVWVDPVRQSGVDAVGLATGAASPPVPDATDRGLIFGGSRASDPHAIVIREMGAPVSDSKAVGDGSPPRVGNLLRVFVRPAIISSLALLVLTAVAVLPNLVFGSTSDLIESGNSEAIDRRALMILGLGVAGAAGAYAFAVNSAKLGQGILYTLRLRLFHRLGRLGIDYYDRELPGLVAARVVHDLAEVADFSQGVVGRLIVNVATLVAAVGLMAVLSPDVAVVVLVFTIAVLVVTLAQVPIAHRAYQRQRARLGEVVSRLEEDLAGRHAIAGAGGADGAVAGFKERAEMLRRADRWVALVRTGHLLTARLLAEAAGAMILWQAGRLALDGTLTLGVVLTLRLNMETALLPALELGSLWQGWLRARVSFQRLNDPWTADPRPEIRPSTIPCPTIARSLQFDRVTFTYPGRKVPSLTDVDLEIPVGSMVVVTGPTGAGKSTLAKIAVRVYDPDSGEVTLDGVPLPELDLDGLRRRIAVVPQDAFCFGGTVASNIAYGRPGASASDIIDAAHAVGAFERLSALPLGFDTPVAEEGRNIGVAERQMIALARAMLVEPDLLILDEATTALDEGSENRVLSAIRENPITTLVITHRRAATAFADSLVSMDGGRVVSVVMPAGDGS